MQCSSSKSNTKELIEKKDEVHPINRFFVKRERERTQGFNITPLLCIFMNMIRDLTGIKKRKGSRISIPLGEYVRKNETQRN